MTPAAPRVSVLMSVREGAFLRPAVETLRAQTLTDAEFVLVDDASDPDTAALLDAYARDEPRVRLIRRARSHGLATALNEGLAACRAPLVARADADDEYHPERLARQVAEMNARPALGVLSCGWDRIDAKGRVIARVTPVRGSSRLAFRHLFGSQLLHPGVVYRRDLVLAAGGYDPAYWTAQDTELWGRLFERTQIDNLPDRLVRWRRHGASITGSRGRAGQKLSAGLSRRHLSAYTGAPLSRQAALAAAQVWRGEAVSLARTRLGLRTLRTVRRAAWRRDEPHERIDLTLRVVRALTERALAERALAERAADGAGRQALPLLAMSARWLAGGLVRRPEATA